MSTILRSGQLLVTLVARPMLLHLAIVCVANGQVTVRGTVTADGAPLAAIPIHLVELSRIAVTDSLGRYLFENVPTGSYTLNVRASGFRSASARISVAAADEAVADFDLQSVAVTLDEVVLVGPGPRSVWVGAHAAYDLGAGTAVDNFQASGRGVLEVLGPHSHRFGTYVTGSVSRLRTEANSEDERDALRIKLRELQRSGNGLSAAVVPHLFWGDPYGGSMTTWLAIGWKLNALDAASGQTHYFHQGVGSVGIELTGLRGFYSQLPTSLSIVPSITVFSGKTYEAVFGDRKTSLSSLSAVLILPAGAGRGLLFDAVATRGAKPAFSVGLLLTSNPNPAALARP